MGFVDIQCTESFIYLLYNGGEFRDLANMPPNMSILIFDWSGNPVKELALDKGIIDFCVEPNDSTIYFTNYNDSGDVEVSYHKMY